jgi:hypothetical protein
MSGVDPDIAKTIELFVRAHGQLDEMKTVLIRAALVMLKANYPELHDEVMASLKTGEWRLLVRQDGRANTQGKFVLLLKDFSGLEVQFLRIIHTGEKWILEAAASTDSQRPGLISRSGIGPSSAPLGMEEIVVSIH